MGAKRSYRAIVLGLIAVVASAAAPIPSLGGTWATAFPATNCQPGAIGPTLTDVGSAGAPLKGAYSFARTSTGLTLLCDVTFPRSVITNSITAKVTYQTPTAPGGNVKTCWRAAWEITRPAQAWGLNIAADATLSSPVSSLVATTANIDIPVSVPFTAVDETATPCVVGTLTGTCAGSHGMLAIVRSASSVCAGEYLGAAKVTHIELSGVTP